MGKINQVPLCACSPQCTAPTLIILQNGRFEQVNELSGPAPPHPPPPTANDSLSLSLWRINSVIFVSRCAHLHRSLTSTSAFTQHFEGGKLLSSHFGLSHSTLITSTENSRSSRSAVWSPLRSARTVPRQVNNTA
jgi:hypothetical protein